MAYADRAVDPSSHAWRKIEASPFIETAIGLSLSGLPTLFHLVSPTLAIAFVMVAGFVLAQRRPGSIVAWIATTFLFQGLFVAMASPAFATASDLEQLKIYNALFAACVWASLAYQVLRDNATTPGVRNMLIVTTGCMALIGAYGAMGLLFDVRGSVVYARNVGLPLALFQIGLVTSAAQSCNLKSGVTVLLGMAICCGSFELIAPETWLTIVHGWTYWDLVFAYEREGGLWVKRALDGAPVVTGVLDLLRTDLFNASWISDRTISIVRLQGPNFHTISFGYGLALLGVFAMALGNWVQVLIVSVLLIFVSAKGPMILFILSVALLLLARPLSGRVIWATLAGFSMIYVLTGLYVGQLTGDYHVLGFWGGVSGFLRWPLGHTLGQGGNLSTNFAGIDWNRFQFEGTSDIAVESGVGVLLFQMGLAGLLLIGVYFWISRLCWKLYERTRSPVAAASAFAIPIVVINGIFQEEALFSPLALALLMLLTGATIGSADRFGYLSERTPR